MSDLGRYQKTAACIKELLEEQGCLFKMFEHEAVRTSEEAAEVRPEYSIEQGAKALIVRVKWKGKAAGAGTSFAQIVLPGDKKFDPRKARNALDAKDIRFATEKEVIAITDGVQPGGVPPFGNIFGLSVYVDGSLFEHEEMIFNAGDRHLSIAMRTADYKRLVSPHIVSIAQ